MRRTNRSSIHHPSLSGVAASVVAAAALAALTACGDAVSPGTTSLSDVQIAADVAAGTGDAIAEEVLDLRDDETAAGVSSATSGATTTGIAAALAGCPYDAASKTHVCTAVTERGLTVTRTYQFLDASSTPTQSYDPANTASILFTYLADGDVAGTTANGVTFSGRTHRSFQRTVSGLLGAETQRVWNGAGQSHDTTDFSGTGGSRRYAGSAIQTTRDVVMLLPHASNPYPASGTITRTVNATLTIDAISGASGTRTISRTITATFDGTAQARVQVNDVTCTYDLSTRRVSDCSRP